MKLPKEGTKAGMGGLAAAIPQLGCEDICWRNTRSDGKEATTLQRGRGLEVPPERGAPQKHIIPGSKDKGIL